MTYRHLLVPIDGTPLGSQTVEGAISLAKSVGAKLTFFHAAIDFGATADGALLHTLDPASFNEGAMGVAQSFLGKAEAAARAKGVTATSQCVYGRRPHEAILEAAHTHGCDLIFLSSHGRRGLKAAWEGSVVHKLLRNTTVPILVACVESNLPPASDEQRALTTIRDEHRSLAAVIHALQREAHSATTKSEAPNFELLRAMLFYIEHFPERLHHPKEEAYLFLKLSERTNSQDALLAKLRKQHADGERLFAALRAGLASFQNGEISASVISAQVEEIAQGQWDHMWAEENLVLPAASVHLHPEDWKAIAAAFHENADPRFGDHADEPFSALCTRLLNLALSNR